MGCTDSPERFHSENWKVARGGSEERGIADRLFKKGEES